MPDAKRTKRSPQEYVDMIAEAKSAGQEGWVEYLSNRFDRDYPTGDDQ